MGGRPGLHALRDTRQVLCCRPLQGDRKRLDLQSWVARADDLHLHPDRVPIVGWALHGSTCVKLHHQFLAGLYRLSTMLEIIPEGVQRMFTPTLERMATASQRVEITDEQVRFYQENGYLVVEGALTSEEVDALRQETVRICRGQLGHVRGLPPVHPTDSDDEVVRRTICVHFPHKISEVMY